MLWKVELDGMQTIVEARTEAAAIKQAMSDYFGRVRATRATKADLAWQRAMSGSLEPPEKKS